MAKPVSVDKLFPKILLCCTKETKICSNLITLVQILKIPRIKSTGYFSGYFWNICLDIPLAISKSETFKDIAKRLSTSLAQLSSVYRPCSYLIEISRDYRYCNWLQILSRDIFVERINNYISFALSFVLIAKQLAVLVYDSAGSWESW